MHVAPIESGYFDANQNKKPDLPPETAPKKKGAKWIPLCIILILTVALIGVIGFLLDNYYVNITELKVLDYSTDRISVELISPDGQECFIVTCTDNYGNSFTRRINGNVYTFTGLREKTAYTITVLPSEYHRIRSGKSYNITVTTPGSTQITELTARRGAQAGEVVLNLTHEGPTPNEWVVSYTDDTGAVGGPFTFADHTYLFTGLEEGRTYHFTVSIPENLYLSGITTVDYTLLPAITVDSMRVSDVSGTSVSISWLCGENVPQEWTVTCESGNYSNTLTTGEMKATFSDLSNFSEAYVFTINAPGMEEPAVFELPAQPIIVEDLKAETQEDGTVLVSWRTPAGTPTGGWHLSYNTVGSLHVPYVISYGSEDMSSNCAILRNVIPNAEYTFTLHLTAEDSSSTLFGQVKGSFTTAAAEPFRGYSLSPAAVIGKNSPNASLWLVPEKENWTWKDLATVKTKFSTDETIVLCIQIEGAVASNDSVDLLYVLRDEEGHVVADEAGQFTWNSLWFDRRHVNEIPLPIAEGNSTSTPGNYVLEVYVNGKLLLERNVVIE